MSLKSIGVVSNVFNILTKDLQNGKNAVIAMQFALRGMKVEQVEAAASALGLNAAQTAVALSAVKMEASEIALKLAMQGYNKEAVIAALMTTGLSEQEAAAAVAGVSFAAAQGTATVALKAFGVALANVVKGLIAFLTTNPVGWAILAAGAIFGIVKAYDALTVSAEEATEQMNESFSEFEEASSQLESLNNELVTANERLAELESKDTLTFVEESELQKLRKSVELLQIQADLAKKKANREAKEAADDTVTAYKKNFKYDISSDAVQKYFNTASETGDDYILLSDPSNISAMIAGIKRIKQLQDELNKDSENYESNYENYQKVIDDATDSIWKQVDVLTDYKGKLEAIPENLRSDEINNYLDEINSAIELSYNALDPAKWKDMQWNNIVNNEQYADDIERLKELASNAKITANDIKKQFPEIVQACEEAGLEIDDVINNLNASYTHSVDNTLQETEAKVLSHGEQIKETLSTLWNAEGFKDTKKSILELASSLDGITANNIDELASSSIELAALLEQDGMSARFLAHVLQTEAMGGDGFALITDDALMLNEALEGLRGRFDEVTDAKSRYDAAMNAPEKDTDFKSYTEAFKELNEQFVAGTTNSNAFWAAAEFLFGADQLQEWGWSDGLDEIYSAMQKNVNIFKDADSAGAGFLDRLYSISDAGKIKADDGSVIAEIKKLSDGSYDFQFDSDDLDALADKLGITSEAALACMQALSMYGDFNFYDIDAVMKAVEEIGLASESINGTAVNVGTLTDQLISLGYTNKDIYDLLNVLQEVDGVTLLDANANVETLVQSLNNLGLAAQDGVEVTVNADGLAELMSQLNFTKEDTQGLITKLGEADNITLTNAQGEVVSLQDALKKTDELQFASVTSELDGITNSADLAEKAVKDLQRSINTLKGKTVTVTVDVQRKQGILEGIFSSLNNSNKKKSSIPTNAKGTHDAPEGDALVGEKGEELVQSGDRAYLVGTNGPEITHLNEGDIVYTAEQTKKIKRGSTVIKGVIPAYAGGTINTNKGSKKGYKSVLSSSKSSNSKSTASQIKDAAAATKSLEEQLEDTLKEMKELLDDIIGDYEHSILLIEHKGADSSKIIEIYKQMQDVVHQQAEKYRAMGLDENSDYIQELQKQWWDYQDSIMEMYDKSVKEHENAIALNENWLNNAIKNTDISGIEKYTSAIIDHYKSMQNEIHEQAEYYRSCGFSDTSDEVSSLSDLWWDYHDNIIEAITNAYESVITEQENIVDITSIALEKSIKNSDALGVTQYTSQIVASYKQMQDTIQQQIEFYRSQNYSETSTEISQLKSLWWSYYDEIGNVVSDAWDKMVNQANSAVDDITKVFSTLKDMAKGYAETGYITVENLQEVCSWGLQYLSLLQNENGQLVINEDNIRKIIAARTEQMAIETALNYVQQIRTALNQGDTASLYNLANASVSAANATWEMVYAQLAFMKASGEIDEGLYNSYITNINNLRSLTDNVVANIDQMYTFTEEIKEDTSAITDALREQKELLEDQADALDDLLKYVKEMIKQEVKNQIKALEDQVDKYKEIVNLQKESLALQKEKDNYNKTVKSKISDISELQQRIAMLDLDGSREAQAEKIKLQEELTELQEDLADTQADHAYDATCDMLDDMATAFEKEKKKEIEILENSISSEEKLYQLAIERIQTQWDSLYSQLITWNTEYGSVTNDKITSAWNAASAAVQQHGSYLQAVLATAQQIASLEAQIKSYQSSSSSTSSTSSSNRNPSSTSTDKSQAANTIVGNVGNYDTSGGNVTSQANNIVAQMKANSAQWFNVDKAGQERLHQANQQLANQLDGLLGLGIYYDSAKGSWYIGSGRKLYDSFPIYHTGGVIGDDSELKKNELLVIAEKGETILTKKQEKGLYRVLEEQETMLTKYGQILKNLIATDLMATNIQDQVRQTNHEVERTVQNNDNSNINIKVPVEIYPVQKLDDSEIKEITQSIGDKTMSRIRDAFYQRGKRVTNPLLKP